jgi:hypothetical protein
MSASALPWLAAGALVWAGAVLMLWALCRAAALADADADADAPRGADAELERTLSTPGAVVAAAAAWTHADDVCLFAGGEDATLSAVAGEGNGQLGLPLHDAAQQAVATGSAVEVWGRGEPPLLVLAEPVCARGRPRGALAVGIRKTGARVGFAERRALLALADAAADTPEMCAPGARGHAP